MVAVVCLRRGIPERPYRLPGSSPLRLGLKTVGGGKENLELYSRKTTNRTSQIETPPAVDLLLMRRCCCLRIVTQIS